MPAKYTWDPVTRLYKTAGGVVVSYLQLREYVIAASLRAEDLFRKISEDYQKDAAREGVEGWRKWRDGMRSKLPPMHRGFAAVALGGIANVTPEEWIDIDLDIRDQEVYFDAFASQVFTGEKAADGAFVAQAQLYGSASYGTFENTRRRWYIQAVGWEEELRVSVADDRRCDVCESEAAKEWSAKGSLRKIGDSPCLVRCRCYFRFRAKVVT